MKIEEEIFYGYILDEEKLTSFGFNYVDNKYIKEYKIHNDEFTALVTIDKIVLTVKSLIIILMKNSLFLEMKK